MKGTVKMSKKFKIVAMITGLLVFLSLAACSGQREINATFTSADYVAHLDVDELTLRATHIIRGEVLDSRVQMINTMLPPFDPDEDVNSGYEIHTVNRIRVVEVFQGRTEPGSVIEVMQLVP